MKKLLLISVWIVETITLARWLNCWHFSEIFAYTRPILTARVITGINDDRGAPALLTHLLHNKLTYGVWGYVQTLLQYVDSRFIKDFIGSIGIIGIYLAVWYLMTKKPFPRWVLFILILIIGISSIELFFIPDILFVWKIVGFGILYEALSLYGIWQFLQVKSSLRVLCIIIFVILSLLTYFLSPLSYQHFCLKI